MNEFNTIKSFFSSIQVHVSDLWLEKCIEWSVTENLAPNYTIRDLQNTIYEQWRFLDLRDLEVPALPPNISAKQKFTLAGNFCLQMMQIVDISKPKLWQLQKIRNNNVLTRSTYQDSEAAGTGKRMLQITLSDGVQEVEAMEYRLVPDLSLNLPPGVKIRIIGPVDVRRGRLMLQPQNVKILGGEVEELLVSNAAENVLARVFKLPENPSPKNIEERVLSVEVEENNHGYSTVPPIKNNGSVVNINTTNQTNVKISNSKRNVQPSKNVIDISEEEEMMLAQEFNAEMDTQPYNLFNNSKVQTSTQINNRANLSLDDDDDEIFLNIDIDTHLNNIDKHSILTIKQLKQIKDFKTEHRIKAKFQGIEEKLTMTDDEFKLVIKVEDATDTLIVKLHSDVIAELLGATPSELSVLKNGIINQETSATATAKLLEALTNVKAALMRLDNEMAIKLEEKQNPIIVKIFN